MRCTIYVKSLRGERIISVDVDSEELENMTVKEFRRRVDRLHPGECRLIYAGKQLEDHKTLRDYGIKHESTVHVIMRMPGGERRTIYVKTSTRERTTPVDVDSEELENMTVREFRRRLDRLDPGEDYRLIYGRKLEDNKTLRDYGIEHESTLIRVKRPLEGERHTINVIDLCGKTTSVHVDSEEELENMTVEELKRRLDPPEDQIRLIFAGKQLEDGRTLGGYGITHESKLHLVLRLRGGADLLCPLPPPLPVFPWPIKPELPLLRPLPLPDRCEDEDGEMPSVDHCGDHLCDIKQRPERNTSDTHTTGLSQPKPSGLDIHPLLNCQSCVHIADSDQWLQIEPSACTDEGGSKFRVSTDPGRYECVRTRMRWVCDCVVTLQYRTVDGLFLNAELERLQCNRIGPVIDVTVISGKLEEVHLPHYACLGESDPSLKDAVKVLTVKDERITTEPVQLTRFHAKIVQPSFSLKTLIISWMMGWDEHCDLLLYMCSKDPLILHLYLFPFDDHAKQKVKEDEKGNEPIKHPRPGRPFRMKTQHILAVSGASTISPEEGITLTRETPPNYFKIKTRLENDLRMTLIREEDKEKVWTTMIEKDDLIHPKRDETRLNSEEEGNQRRNMPSVKELLMNSLRDLGKDDLKQFQWLLRDDESITKSEMENADVLDTVDMMVARSGPEEAVKITVKLLRKMNQNYLAEQLENKHKEARTEGNMKASSTC